MRNVPIHLCPRYTFVILGLLLGAICTCLTRAEATGVLNECMASNLTTLYDEDGDTPDWIEIYNPGSAATDLTGWGLSDDLTDPLMWTFPAVTLGGQERILIYASAKDRRDWAPHWETIITWGDDWRYRVNTTAPPENWRALTFPDSIWSEGPSGFGFGDSDDSTAVPLCISLSARHTFDVDDPLAVRHLALHVDYDDAFVAWLNGVEIARGNISSSGPPDWDQPADGNHEAQIYQGGYPESFTLPNASAYLQSGPNVLAIEVHNIAADNFDLSLIPFLTLGLESAPPGGGQGTPDLLRFCLPHLHTNFKLSACGGELALSNPGGVIHDVVATGQMYIDMSYGREYDGSQTWVHFAAPTPQAPNTGGGYAEFADPPAFSIEGGFYDAPLVLTLTAPPSGGEIYYTVGGSVPLEAPLYAYLEPIAITATTVVRARVYAPNRLPSPITTQTYFLEESSTLPVVSLVTDPENLWSEETGIYTLGPNASSSFPYWGANFWQDWERPIHIEFYEQDQSLAFQQDAGVKIHGGFSRGYPQKSLRLLARGGYGTAAIQHRIFAEKDLTSFSQLLLRNAGSDWCRGHMRDGLLHRLSVGMGLARQAFRPTLIFLNSEYWGMQHARERINGDYLAANYGCDPDNVDLLQNHNEVMAGDNLHYIAMLDYIASHDLSDDEVFAHVESLMDTDDFATYYILEVFSGNTDWPGGNIRYWRPRTPEGRWRWILSDLDWGLGYDVGYTHNTLAFALAAGGSSHPNPDWSTFLMRSLLENEVYRTRFINIYSDHLNSTFLATRTHAIFDDIANEMAPEMVRHMTRWEHTPSAWDDETALILIFIANRPTYARHHIMQQFGLPPTLWNLELGIEPQGAGRIALTAIEVDSVWTGTYFQSLPVALTALPNPGYRFAAWSDPELPSDPHIVIQPDSNYVVAAHFTEIGNPADTLIIINEINYHSSDIFDPGDWLELYNASDEDLDISGWIFQDEEEAHLFILPAGTWLAARDYLVLCQDTTAFMALFPDVAAYVGEFDFGLSNGGELLRLFNPAAALHDSVPYGDDPPWPPEPDGDGPTLELVSPQLDNALASSWGASVDHGTPGALNSIHSGASVDPARDDRETLGLPDLGLQRNIALQTSAERPICFALDRARPVALTLFDVTGRRVAGCAYPMLAPGIHSLAASALQGTARLSPGLYWLRMDSLDYCEVRKLCVLR